MPGRSDTDVELTTGLLWAVPLGTGSTAPWCWIGLTILTSQVLATWAVLLRTALPVRHPSGTIIWSTTYLDLYVLDIPLVQPIEDLPWSPAHPGLTLSDLYRIICTQEYPE